MEQLEAIESLLGRFANRDAADNPHVAADVVFVARVDGEFDVLVGFRRRDAEATTVDVGMEAFADRFGDHLAQPNRLVRMVEDEAELPRLGGDASGEDATLDHQRGIIFNVGRRVDEDGALRRRQYRGRF